MTKRIQETPLLVNASFVGGYGATRKVISFIQALKEKGLSYQLATDSRFKSKLDQMQITADFIIPYQQNPLAAYQAVNRTLAKVNYQAMVSFGWRTFVPANAIDRGKSCVIIDGGWPDVLEDWPGQFSYVGGFLTPTQQDECRGFVTRLIMELDQKPDAL